MPRDPVAEALRVAALATIPNAAAVGDEPSRTELRNTAAAIAAFLHEIDNGERIFPRDLAAAVERAAREGRDGG